MIFPKNGDVYKRQVFLYQIFYKLEEKLMNAFVKKVRKNGGNNWLGKIMRRIGLV